QSAISRPQSPKPKKTAPGALNEALDCELWTVDCRHHCGLVSSVFLLGGSRFINKRNSLAFCAVPWVMKIFSCALVKTRPRVSVRRCCTKSDGFARYLGSTSLNRSAWLLTSFTRRARSDSAVLIRE